MSIDPQRLRAASQLILGSSFSPEHCRKIAGILGVKEEILPWLVLRRNAFKAYPEFQRHLKVAAERCPTSLSKRSPTHASSQETQALLKSLDESLSVLISENIKSENIAHSVESNVSKLVRNQSFDEIKNINIRAVSSEVK